MKRYSDLTRVVKPMVADLSMYSRERRKMAQWLRLLAIRLELITKNPQARYYQEERSRPQKQQRSSRR